MIQRRIRRREAIKTGAAVLTLGAAPTALARLAAKPKTGLTVGMATAGFRQYTNARLAKELVAEGVHTVQLFLAQSDSNYWRYNNRSDLSDLSADRCNEIADTYSSAGVSIHSIGVYMNVSTFITEAGHYHHANEPAPRIEYHFQEEVWKMMVATGKELAAMAERYKATVLFEPFYRHFFASAKRTRVYLEEIGSPRMRALLDPANLLEVNDLDEMFDQLEPWIDCLHAKDRKLHVDRGVPAGQGDLDYSKFVTLAARRTPNAPLILEYVGPNDYRQALARQEAGSLSGCSALWILVGSRIAGVPEFPAACCRVQLDGSHIPTLVPGEAAVAAGA